MNPILFAIRLGDHAFTVKAYGFFLVLGILATLVSGFVFAARTGVPKWRAGVIILASGLVGLFGARLLNAAVNGQLGGGLGPVFAPGLHSFSLYGALVLGCAVAVALSQALRVPSWRFLDVLVPGVAAGIALARVGCFLNGCCFGTRTAGPTGVTFPPGSLPWLYDLAHAGPSLLGGSAKVHPTQLYEIGGALGAMALALWAERSYHRRTRSRTQTAQGVELIPGIRFLVFAALFSAFRLFNLCFRAPVFATDVPEWFYPVLYGVLIAGCGAVLWIRIRRGRSTRLHANSGQTNL